MKKLWLPEDGYADIVVGLQFGDEAKARIVDMLAEHYDIVIRYNGGANAGHTVVHDGKRLNLRQIPSAVLYPNKQLFIAAACMVSLGMLDEEITNLEKAGISVRDRLKIAGLASVVQPHQVLRDKLTGGGVSTTNQGMGPCQEDHMRRVDAQNDSILDIRIGDLMENFDHYFAQMKKNWDAELQRWNLTPEEAKAKFGIDIGKEWEKIEAAVSRLRQHDTVENDPFYLTKQILEHDKKALLEGAQSIALDAIYGTHPYNTVSNITPAAALHSAGINDELLRRRYGVLKLVTSRVGKGPYIGEWGGMESEHYWNAGNGYGHTRKEEEETYGTTIEDLQPLLTSGNPFKIGMALRILGGEYGTSGRPRRVGKLDMTLLRAFVKGFGIDQIFATKADQLQHLSHTGSMPVIDALEINGRQYSESPLLPELLRKAKEIEKPFDTFDHDISGVRSAAEVPWQVHKLIQYIQDETGGRIIGLGVGPGREQYVPYRDAL